jgi:hypothetical protein
MGSQKNVAAGPHNFDVQTPECERKAVTGI